MAYFKHLFVVLAVTSFSNAVKVNMQGTLTLGKEVMDTVTYFMRQHHISGRRSMLFGKDSSTDTISLLVNSAFLCRDLDICKGKTRTFVNEYIIILAKTVESLLKELSNDKVKEENNDEAIPNLIIFENKLNHILRDTKKILTNANKKITDEKEAFIWTDIIKKVSAMFQERAILFVTDQLEGDPKDVNEVKKKLIQTFVIATIEIEIEHQNKLCMDYNICVQSYECTKALNTILTHLKTMPEEKVKSFVRYLYEALPDTTFYYHLSEVTANEFQVILDDMSYSHTVATREVLTSVQKSVESRLNSIDTKSHSLHGRDVELVHVILSDMDHFYSKNKIDPFNSFVEKLYVWSHDERRLGSHIRQVIKDICNKLSFEPEDLVLKLTREVRVFLEVTIDPLE